MNHMNGVYDREGGSGRYNYQPEFHNIFQKPDVAEGNTNQYFNKNYANQPFSFGRAQGRRVSP